MAEHDEVIREIQRLLRAGTFRGMPLTVADRAALNRTIKALQQAPANETTSAPDFDEALDV
jgi:hypothetical protein